MCFGAASRDLDVDTGVRCSAGRALSSPGLLLGSGTFTLGSAAACFSPKLFLFWGVSVCFIVLMN